LKIAIIGGAGKMGQWFARVFLNDGMNVAISDILYNKNPDYNTSLAGEFVTVSTAIDQADVVLMSVPMDNFEESIEEVSGYIRPGQIVIDISSVKARPVELMHKYITKGLALGVHPMFGPGAINLENRNVVLTPTNIEEKNLANRVETYLKGKGARVFQIPPEEHDELMSIVLGLPSFIAIVSADALLSLNKLKITRDISGSTYKLLLMLTESIVTKDANLYASLQMALPNIAEIEDVFLQKVVDWITLVKDKDRPKFLEKLHNLENNFKLENPNFDNAYENMYKVIDVL